MSKNLSPRQRRLAAALTGTLAALAVSLSLTGAAAAPSAEPTPPATQACWAEYESGQTACAADAATLAKTVLEKFNKVSVASPEEFERIKAAGSYRSLAVPSGVLASYAIGTLWSDAGYTGSSTTYNTQNSSTCYGQTYTFSFPSLALNDQISSFAGSAACQVRLYDDINYGGGFYGYFDCRSNLAAAGVNFNDRASSVRFHLTSTYSCF